MNQVIIFGGDDLVSSRKAFLEYLESLKKDDFVVERATGKNLTGESLELLTSPTSLFGEKKALAIENLLSGPKGKEKDKIIEIVSLLHCPIVVWENKEFSKTEQQKFPLNFVFRNFKLPSCVFSFLEKLAPGKSGNNLENLLLALEVSEAGFLFLMLVRQIRLLILAKDLALSPKTPSWQKGKLENQAKDFSMEQLTALYQKLLEIDFQQKTSATPFPLEHQLELLVAEI